MDIASLGTDIDADLNRIRSRGGERPKKPPRYSQDFIFPIEGSDAYQFLFDDESEELCASGPYGCSKTFVSVMKLHRRALYAPGAYGIARKTKESIKKSVCKTYAKVLGYDPMLTKKTYVRGNGGQNPQSYHYPNGSVIHIVGLNHLDGLLSTEFDGIFVNQAEEAQLRRMATSRTAHPRWQKPTDLVRLQSQLSSTLLGHPAIPRKLRPTRCGTRITPNTGIGKSGTGQKRDGAR